MSFDSKRNIMLVTLILASMMIPIFGIRQNAAASGGSGHGIDEAALIVGESNQIGTTTKSNGILPTRKSTESHQRFNSSAIVTVKPSAQVLASKSPMRDKLFPTKLTNSIDSQSKQGSTVSLGAPSTTIIPKPSKTIVNSPTEVVAKKTDSMHVAETTKSKERPTKVPLTQEETKKSPSDDDLNSTMLSITDKAPLTQENTKEGTSKTEVNTLKPTQVYPTDAKPQNSTPQIKGNPTKSHDNLKPTNASSFKSKPTTSKEHHATKNNDKKQLKPIKKLKATSMTTLKNVATTREKTNARTKDYSKTDPEQTEVTKHPKIALRTTNKAHEGASKKTYMQDNGSKPTGGGTKKHNGKEPESHKATESKFHNGRESQRHKETESKSDKAKESQRHKGVESGGHKEKNQKKESDGIGDHVEWIRRKTFKENNRESGNFAVLFMVAIVMVVGLYALYHNRQRIVAIVIEGRSPDHRRPKTNKYTKLEDAMPSVRKIMT